MHVVGGQLGRDALRVPGPHVGRGAVGRHERDGAAVQRLVHLGGGNLEPGRVHDVRLAEQERARRRRGRASRRPGARAARRASARGRAVAVERQCAQRDHRPRWYTRLAFWPRMLAWSSGGSGSTRSTTSFDQAGVVLGVRVVRRPEDAVGAEELRALREVPLLGLEAHVALALEVLARQHRQPPASRAGTPRPARPCARGCSAPTRRRPRGRSAAGRGSARTRRP